MDRRNNRQPPYRVLADGRLVFDEARYGELEHMFRAALIDITSITTEAEYERAFAQAGDFYFATLQQDAAAGDQGAVAIIRAFVNDKPNDAKALVRRLTFEVIEGGRAVPRQSCES